MKCEEKSGILIPTHQRAQGYCSKQVTAIYTAAATINKMDAIL